MSESDSEGGAGTREIAHRLFAAEFDDADFSYSESDEERAPNYVVTPTGARVNRLFVVGVLTEIEQVNEEVLRARVVDPTGAFVVYAGQYQPDELAFLEAATPPMFVAVTGKARTFEPDDGDRVFTSVRPESISEVDAGTRDRWVVQAAQQTLDRIGRLATAKSTGLAGDELHAELLDRGVAEADAAGATLALDHYDTTGDYLQALHDLVLDAARVVAGERDEAGSLSRSPGGGTDDPIPVLAETSVETTDPDASEPATTTEAAADPGPGTPAEETGSEPTAGATGDDTEPSPTPDTGAQDETASTAPDADSQPTETTGGVSEVTATTTEQSSEERTETEGTSETTATATGQSAETTGESTEATDDDIGEFEPEFELDEDEREELEDEFGTDFQSGSEVDDPGEAGIETPDPEELADEAPSEQGSPAGAADAEPAPESSGAPAGSESPEPGTEAATGEAVTETPSTATDAGADETAGDEADVDTGDVDLEDAVMEVMEELDDGDGADREAVTATVVDRYGADPGDVEDAVQDALMGGRCYEPADGKLTPI